MVKLSGLLLQGLDSAQTWLGYGPAEHTSQAVHINEAAFTTSWQVLGPFQVGTREAPWGSDPLERYGGFHSLSWDEHARFPSSLAANGSVGWSRIEGHSSHVLDRLTSDIEVSFDHIDWNFLRTVYGWAALQWQAWIRGSIIIESEEAELLNLYISHAVEFWLDDEQYYGGDFYGYARAPLTLRLEPGPHRIDIRVVRDVRAMGGITSNPAVEVNLRLERTKSGIHRGSPVMLPDRLQDFRGPTAGVHGTVILHNVAEEDVFVHSIWGRRNICNIELVGSTPIRLMPGQSRPVGFTVSCIPGTSASSSIDLHFQYSYNEDGSNQRSYFAWGLPRQPINMYEPHRMTFLHPSGIVSYAILRAPPMSCQAHDKLPVLLQLHGAGLEADDDLVKHALDGVPDLCAWVLFPSGVTPWSGDDWHKWGWSDVEAAILAIQDWIELVDWQGPGVDVNHWLVSGHSNGGQGTWHAVTHHPDNVIAAAPVSGYSSIQNYVPYTFWQPASPARSSIVESQLAKYKHELLLDNVKYIPILLQHGSADDNVPAYHSRFMYELGQMAGAHLELSEIPGEGHWWDGVMVTPSLSDFYEKHLPSPESGLTTNRNVSSFSLVTASSSDMVSKNGITIEQLKRPEQLGRLDVEIANHSCTIRSSNIRAIKISSRLSKRCNKIEIDGGDVGAKSAAQGQQMSFRWSSSSGWIVITEHSSDHCQRSAAQQGGLEAILHTTGPFQIAQYSRGVHRLALEIANNLCQYYNADAELSPSVKHAKVQAGNIISIAVGENLPSEPVGCDDVSYLGITPSGKLGFMQAGESEHEYERGADGAVAAIFLRPLPGDRTELVIWANEPSDLYLAARLFPIMTGSGQPDFVIIDKSMAYRGLEGVLAMGFYDENWSPSHNSFFS